MGIVRATLAVADRREGGQERATAACGAGHRPRRAAGARCRRSTAGCGGGGTQERRPDAPGRVQLRAGASLIDLVDGAGEPGRRGGRRRRGRGTWTSCACGGRRSTARRWRPGCAPVACSPAPTDRATAPAARSRRRTSRGTGPSPYPAGPEGNPVELKGRRARPERRARPRLNLDGRGRYHGRLPELPSGAARQATAPACLSASVPARGAHRRPAA
jgi:glyoxylase I family protein